MYGTGNVTVIESIRKRLYRGEDVATLPVLYWDQVYGKKELEKMGFKFVGNSRSRHYDGYRFRGYFASLFIDTGEVQSIKGNVNSNLVYVHPSMPESLLMYLVERSGKVVENYRDKSIKPRFKHIGAMKLGDMLEDAENT